MGPKIDGRRISWLGAIALALILVGGAPCRAHGGDVPNEIDVGDLRMIALADVGSPNLWEVFGPNDNVTFSSGPEQYFQLVNLDANSAHTFAYSWTFTLETKADGTPLYATQDSSGASLNWAAMAGQTKPIVSALLFDFWANPGMGAWYTKATTTVTSGTTHANAEHEHFWAHF